MRVKRLSSAIAILFLATACSSPSKPASPASVKPTTTTTTSTTTTSTTLPVVTTTTTVAKSAPYVSHSGNCPVEIEALIHKHFDPLGAYDFMRAVVWRESNCRPEVWNRVGKCFGLAQLALPLHNDLFTAAGFSPNDWANPDANLAAAAILYKGAGSRPWAL